MKQELAAQLADASGSRQARQLNMINSGAGTAEHSVLEGKFMSVNSIAHGEHRYALETLATSLSDVVCYPYKREVSLLFSCEGHGISTNIIRREDFTIELSISLLKPYRQLEKIMPYLKLSDIEFTKLTLIFADVIAEREKNNRLYQQDYKDELARLSLRNTQLIGSATAKGWGINIPYPGKVLHSKTKKQGFWGSLFGDKK